MKKGGSRLDASSFAALGVEDPEEGGRERKWEAADLDATTGGAFVGVWRPFTPWTDHCNIYFSWYQEQEVTYSLAAPGQARRKRKRLQRSRRTPFLRRSPAPRARRRVWRPHRRRQQPMAAQMPGLWRQLRQRQAPASHPLAPMRHLL